MTRLRHDPPRRRAARCTNQRTLAALTAPDHPNTTEPTDPAEQSPTDIPAGDPWNRGAGPFPPPLVLRLGPRSWRRLAAASVICGRQNRPLQ